ncbi:MAG: TlpA disulfide reductase family protein [Deltaproteobacteria bacterium]|nr:TlpA disulfide reductase family protein [Deltaproteobacteria bacterium]
MDGKFPRGAVVWQLLASVMFLLALTSSGRAQSAPDFALKDVLRGQEYTLSQFKGKVVLLNFFTFLCKPCKEEMPFLNQIDQELKSQGFQTIGIGLASTPAELRSLAQQLGLNYPVLVGTDEVSKAWKVEFVPATFIIDRQGNIVHKIFDLRSKEDFVKLIKPLL